MNNNPQPFKKERLTETIAHAAAEFFNRLSNRQSLITVTRVELADNRRYVKIYLGVIPEEKEQEVLAFAERRASELREAIADRVRLKQSPFVKFYIDEGEKNRQRIEELLAKGHNND